MKMRQMFSCFIPVFLLCSMSCSGMVSDFPPSLPERVSADAEKIHGGKYDYIHYVVEPLSNIKRMPSVYPEDGKAGAPLVFLAAQDEYEAASFLLYSFRDAEKVELIPEALTGKGGVIPASALDLKIVKLWYQTGTAWHSYFADSTGRQLIPELLLNDETLVEADLEGKENYLRVGGKDGRERRLWISAPPGTYEKLDPNRVLVADADTFQSFRLPKNKFKQIWVTLHAPSGMSGIFHGGIRIRINGRDSGSIPVTARILPFRLPPPRTAYDLSQPFFAGSYNSVNLARYVKANGGDTSKAEKRVRAEYESFRRHNLLYPLIPSRNVHTKAEDVPFIHHQLRLYKEAGLGTEALFDAVTGFPSYTDLASIRKLNPETELVKMPLAEKWMKIVKEESMFVRSIFGKDAVIYCFGWDEPAVWLLRAERPSWKFLHDNGLKVFSTANRRHLLHSGFNEDFVNYGGRITKDDTRVWHEAGAKITSYADPHTGIENPDFVRRTHGMYPYLINSDGSMNYMVCGSDWNDFLGSVNNFRSFNWIYPGTYRPVETIQYEAFREAIDDVRYATLLRRIAGQAMSSGKTENIYKARAALLYLAQLNPDECDLNTVRTEMIRYILELRNLK